MTTPAEWLDDEYRARLAEAAEPKAVEMGVFCPICERWYPADSVHATLLKVMPISEGALDV